VNKKMRTLLVAILFILGTLQVSAQTPQWQWVKTGVDNDIEPGGGVSVYTTGSTITCDGQNNILVAGVFYDSMQLDTVLLTGAGKRDIFVAKYAIDGHLQWARSAGGKQNDQATAIGTDRLGDVYVAGFFTDTAYFGNVPLVSIGEEDIFLAKYNPDGVLIWVKRAGSVYGDLVGGLYVDNTSHVFITGNYMRESGSSSFPGTADFDTITITSRGAYGIFIAKYDSSGNALWAKSEGGPIGGGGGSITSDIMGNIFITGGYSETCYFDSIELNVNATDFSNNNMFIAKFDSNGKALWANQAGGGSGGVAGGYSVVTDVSGNSYVCGLMWDTRTLFSSIAPNGTQTYPVILGGIQGIYNGYIAKYNAGGKLLWAKNMNIDLEDYNEGDQMVIDEHNNLYITGSFEGHSYLKDTTVSRGSYDAYVAKYDSSGNGQWFMRGGGPSSDQAYGITFDRSGSLYTTGYYDGNATFGSCVANGGASSFFVAKLSPGTGLPIVAKLLPVIVMYPNPTNTGVTIDMGNSRYNAISVTDCLGRLVYTQAINNQKTVTVNTMTFADGIYFVTASGDEATVNEKLIVTH